MSDTAAPAQNTARGAGMVPLVLIGGAILLALLVFGTGERPLKRSATGFDALVSWLRANDIEARAFTGGAPLERDSLGLRILPLFDTDLEAERTVPESREDMIAQTSERDLSRWVVSRKVRDQPTLIVAPKWRTGLRVLSVAHRDLLIPDDELNRVLRQGRMDPARIRRDPEGMTDWRIETGDDAFTLRILHPQTVQGAERCTVEAGTPARPLLLACESRDVPDENTRSEDATDADTEEANTEEVNADEATPQRAAAFWILTDPDLINNHGLAYGQNAEAALAMIRDIAGDGPVIVDWTDRVWTARNAWEATKPDRTWEDLARLFAWPFAMIWIAFLALAGLVFWRAAVRYGPTAHAPEDEPMAAKTTSIDAKARLLRLANHDAALLKTHISARIAQLTADILGPHRPAGVEPIDVLRPVVARANPALARDLDEMVTTQPPGADALRHLDRFETLLDRIRHEFGRPSDLR